MEGSVLLDARVDGRRTAQLEGDFTWVPSV